MMNMNFKSSPENIPKPPMDRLTPGVEIPFDLTRGPINILVGDTSLRIVDPSRDLAQEDISGVRHNGKSYILNSVIGAFIISEGFDMHQGKGFKGLREGERVLIGRNKPGRFELDSSVSRNHLAVERQGDFVYLQDMGSTNGTLVAQRILNTPLGTTVLSAIEMNTKPESRYDYKITASGSSTASESHPDYNDDTFFVDTDNLAFGVFDGVGGLSGSAQASRIASETIKDFLKRASVDNVSSPVPKQLTDAMLAGHDAILSQTTERVATTATIAKIFTDNNGEQFVAVESVGDSRAYLLRDGELKMLTIDHGAMVSGTDSEKLALQQKLANVVDVSELSVKEQALFKDRNMISNSLGDRLNDPSFSGTITHVKPGDKIFLSTDGVHDNLTTDEIKRLLNSDKADSEIVDDVIWAALMRSRNPKHIRAKEDDTTAVVVTIGG